jgi:hypothetical protein
VIKSGCAESFFFQKLKINNWILLLLAGIFLNLILIMNPGYYSHEELQFLKDSSNISWTSLDWQPPRHNVEYRPVGRNFELMVMSLLGMYPQFVHLVHTVIHILNAFIVFILAGKLFPELGEKFQITASLFFMFSPLASFGAGWAAAVYDLLYVLFAGVILVLYSRRNDAYFNGPLKKLILYAGIFILTALALLTKETAVMIVWYLFLLLVFAGFDRKGIVIFISACTATLIYAFIRISSLFHIAVESTSGYKVSLGQNILQNFTQYFLYPFTAGVTEIHNVFVLTPAWMLLTAAGIHIVVIVLLSMRRFVYAIWYLVAFVFPLMPILIINMTASHYLYASAIPLSIALAYLLFRTKNKFVYTLIVGSVLLLAAHSIVNQTYLFNTGIYQRKILTSMAALVSSEDTGTGCKLEKRIVMVTDPKSPNWILARVLRAVNSQNEIDGIEIEQILMITEQEYENRNRVEDGGRIYFFYHEDGSLLLRNRVSL